MGDHSFNSNCAIKSEEGGISMLAKQQVGKSCHSHHWSHSEIVCCEDRHILSMQLFINNNFLEET